MSVQNKHPSFVALRKDDWKLMRDTVNGESAVKFRKELYLPMPSGFKAMNDQGEGMYGAYKKRARFPEIVAPTLAAMVGTVHEKEITIEMPDSMDYIHERATKTGLTLDAFHRRITNALLLMGRYGVLVDAPEDGGEPFMCGYSGDMIINWDDEDDFYVLDDTGNVRDGFIWTLEQRFIELVIEEGKYVQRVHIGGEITESTPSSSGGRVMDRIPFVVANSKDISPDIITPPLIGVARSAIAKYQLSADYRHQLFMSGQETLVAINGEAPQSVGAGVVHQMTGAPDLDVDLKYVSPECIGIEAHKVAMDGETEEAVRAGAKLLEAQDTSNESGKAKMLRTASNNSVLSSIAKVSCEVLEKSLRNIAMMQGLDKAQQDKITVRPPKDLGDTTMSPQDAWALVQSWQANGFSYRTLYENLQRGGIANPERTYEDELTDADSDPEAVRQAQEDALTTST